jgi:biotin carboxylase
MTEVCAIVDGVSTGRFLFPAFRERGWHCVHVLSRREMLPYHRASFVAHDYLADLRHDGSVERTAAALEPYRPRYVIAGAETGVLLADQLSETLGLPGNGPAMALARRNKYLMVEAVRAAGLPSVEHIKSSSLDELRAWVAWRGSWPVVAKPLDSAGTDLVTFCRSTEELERSFTSIISTRTIFDERNREVLVQEYLEGPEFMVNTISRGGRHRVIDMWQVTKKDVGGAPVYDLEVLVPVEGNEALVRYVYDALDALEIRHGPAHSEVIMTRGGPKLVEIGARLEGAIDPNAVAASVGFDPVAVTVDSYVDPAAFEQFSEAPHRLLNQSFCAFLISPRSGVLRRLAGEERIRQLGSYFSSSLRVKPGQRIQETVDLQTTPGLVYLVHPDRARLEADYRAIRQLEQDGLYDVGPYQE